MPANARNPEVRSKSQDADRVGSGERIAAKAVPGLSDANRGGKGGGVHRVWMEGDRNTTAHLVCAVAFLLKFSDVALFADAQEDGSGRCHWLQGGNLGDGFPFRSTSSTPSSLLRVQAGLFFR